MNSGKGGSLDATFEKLTLEELGEVLPEFEVIDEAPLTAPFNYVIVWGHKPQQPFQTAVVFCPISVLA